jgi:hypothetical protein
LQLEALGDGRKMLTFGGGIPEMQRDRSAPAKQTYDVAIVVGISGAATWDAATATAC